MRYGIRNLVLESTFCLGKWLTFFEFPYYHLSISDRNDL
jgi:hypothetical protein